jgi:hypothetical protein
MIADGKTYECTLYGASLVDAELQAHREAPRNASSITVEADPGDAASVASVVDAFNAALNKPRAEFIKAPKPIDLGAAVTAALAAKDVIIAQLMAERDALRVQARK